MANQHKKTAGSYTREFPPDVGTRQADYDPDKWQQLDSSLEGDFDVLIVAYPEVLGDSYDELMINLSKIVDSGKELAIANPSPYFRIDGKS